MNILLVDDDPRAAEDLALLFPTHMKILFARGSPEALSIIEQKPTIDAIVTDLRLPRHLAEADDCEGLHLVGALRKRLGPRIPILVLSSVPKEEVEHACLARGANGYIEKPCVVPILAWLLTELTRGSQEDRPGSGKDPADSS